MGQAVDAEIIANRNASSVVPPMANAVVSLVYPSRPVVRPESTSSSMCRIRYDRITLVSWVLTAPGWYTDTMHFPGVSACHAGPKERAARVTLTNQPFHAVADVGKGYHFLLRGRPLRLAALATSRFRQRLQAQEDRPGLRVATHADYLYEGYMLD